MALQRSRPRAVLALGEFLGSSDDATHRFDFPTGSVHAGQNNVLSVMVENMGHNEDFNADDSHKQPRGLTGATYRRLGSMFAFSRNTLVGPNGP